LDLEVYPYLPRARVATTSARAYLNAVHFVSWIAALKSTRVVGSGARGRSG
jgi:hypothetical protein